MNHSERIEAAHDLLITIKDQQFRNLAIARFLGIMMALCRDPKIETEDLVSGLERAIQPYIKQPEMRL